MNFFLFFISCFLFISLHSSDNQTDAISPVFSQNSLPFRIRIEKENFLLSQGLQSYFFGVHDGKWLLLGGRTNGLHTFDNNTHNFPPKRQNTVVYVVDPENKKIIASKALDHPTSGLTQRQIDQLSVTAGQQSQYRDTLYLVGGYGIDTSTGNFNTKSSLTAINIPGLMKWVSSDSKKEKATHYIRQTTHPWLQVTGGYMAITDPHLSSLLIFGQNFSTFYVDNSNGAYTRQIRRFQIIDTGEKLFIQPLYASSPNPSYRRRDLNVVPILKGNKQAFIALSGVFTIDTGIWTVPVIIQLDGTSSMSDPNGAETFKQPMNNYYSAKIPLYSKKSDNMYIVVLGGLTFGYFSNGIFQVDQGIRFTNQITTISIDKEGKFRQHLMEEEYPVIPSTGANPGEPLLFGASAEFIPARQIPSYPNGVLQLDQLNEPIVIGYILGGIMSTLPHVGGQDRKYSLASPYIFRVILEPS